MKRAEKAKARNTMPPMIVTEEAEQRKKKTSTRSFWEHILNKVEMDSNLF